MLGSGECGGTRVANAAVLASASRLRYAARETAVANRNRCRAQGGAEFGRAWSKPRNRPVTRPGSNASAAPGSNCRDDARSSPPYPRWETNRYAIADLSTREHRKIHKEVEHFLEMGSAPNPVPAGPPPRRRSSRWLVWVGSGWKTSTHRRHPDSRKGARSFLGFRIIH